MDLGAAGLYTQPFPTHGEPPAVVMHEAGREAIEVLESTYAHRSGLSLLQGPTLSGRSTLIRSFVNSLPEDCAVAIVDGMQQDAATLLRNALRQFGYQVDLSSANEYLGLLRVVTMQQAANHEPPLLIVENTQDLSADAMHALCKLAELRVRTGSALKIVLVGDRPLRSMIDSAATECLALRLLHDFHLRPMTEWETRAYLHSKLRAAGSDIPEFVVPDSVCRELFKASGGWPGIVDRLALLALAHAETLPVAVEDVEYPALPAGTANEPFSVYDSRIAS